MDPKQERRWTNINAFIAQLAQAAEVRYPSPEEDANFNPAGKSRRTVWLEEKAKFNAMDYSSTALQVFSMALQSVELSVDTLARSAALPAACVWFIYAAERLWANVQNKRSYIQYDDNGDPVQERNYPFTRDNWDSWKGCLETAKDACKDDVKKRLIEDALAEIRRVMADS